MSEAALFPAAPDLTRKTPTAAPMIKATERQMLDHLAARYGQRSGNGVRYVFADHVRSAAGFDARRTADFMAMDLWPSTGLELHGHEVKVSRSDWLTELKDPTKADEFRRYMDRWWLVVPDARIVRDDLPPGWGLLVLNSRGLHVARRAPKLHPEPMPKSMMAAFLRATAYTAARPTTTPVPAAARDTNRPEGHA